MASDGQKDWVDRVMAQSVWQPPDDFASRVAVRAMTALPVRVPPQPHVHIDMRSLISVTIAGFRESMRMRIEGTLWAFAQYRQLLFR